MKDYQELKLGNYKELIREVYFFLKDNKIIPISESAQNLDKDFFYKTEQLLTNKAITASEKSELNNIFANASSENELVAFIAGVYLTKNLFECLYNLKWK